MNFVTLISIIATFTLTRGHEVVGNDSSGQGQQCLDKYPGVLWRLRQDLSADWTTAVGGFHETFQEPNNPNFASRVVQHVTEVKPLSPISWEVHLVKPDGHRSTVIETVISSSETCQNYKGHMTNDDGQSIVLDFEFVITLEKSESGKISIVLGLVACSTPNNPNPAIENYACNESGLYDYMLTHLKRYACLVELFPNPTRAQVCQALRAGGPPRIGLH